MANRIPLVVDSVNLNLKELPAGDNMDLGNSNVINVLNINANSTITSSVYGETVSTVSISGGNVTYNLSSAGFFVTRLTEDIDNVFFTNPPATDTVCAFVVQLIGNGAANTVVWPSTVKYAENTAPTIATTNNYINTFAFYTIDGGSSFIGTGTVEQYN